MNDWLALVIYGQHTGLSILSSEFVTKFTQRKLPRSRFIMIRPLCTGNNQISG